ncbi:hypothetical protein NKG94_21020 [Micromonospora sp. M12]
MAGVHHRPVHLAGRLRLGGRPLRRRALGARDRWRLAADSDYYYRFRAQGQISRSGGRGPPRRPAPSAATW